jgi:6-phosphogluconolactonase
MGVLVFASNTEVSAWLDENVARLSREAIARSGKFIIAVSGGSLPVVLASKLKDNKDVDWSQWHVFFADERCVPLDHADSNYLLTKDSLLKFVPIPESQVYAINENFVSDPPQAAADYQKQLETVFGLSFASGSFPEFDLILLGMGPDGHTCSLFPGHPLLQERLLWVSSLTDSPKPPPSRITLTYPVLDAAKNVVYVTTGGGKAEIFKKMFDDKVVYPAGLGKAMMLLQCRSNFKRGV